MNARKRKILKKLLENKKPITSEYLSRLLGVSSRTVRNDIKELNEEIKDKAIKIITLPGVGYFIKFTGGDIGKDVIEEVLDDDNNAVPSMPDERVRYIIKRLLTADCFITLEELATELFVSKSTIVNDVNTVEKWLSKHNLRLFRKPNYGIKVKGNEMNLRFAISDFINEQNNNLTLFDVSSYEEMFKDISLEKIKNIISEAQKDMDYKLSSISFSNLLIHIAIAIKRIRQNKSIDIPDDAIKNMKNKREYMVAQNIVKSIEKNFNVNMPEGEAIYITMHLLGAKPFEDNNLDLNDIRKIVGDKLINVVKKMIYEVGLFYNIDFSRDKELIIGLALHLKPTLNRLKYNMNLRNPILNEIKDEYPDAFEMSITASRILKREYSISIDENEMGYIAMYFGAAIERLKIKTKKINNVVIICASGMGTAQLIATKVMRTFPWLNIIGKYPSYKLEEVTKANPDLILTTVPINIVDIPVIQISSILSKDDIERIGKIINIDSNTRSDRIALLNLFDERLFVKNLKIKDKFEIINYLSEMLYKNNYVYEEFKKSVIERELISSTSIGNLVAIPHSTLGYAIESHIAVAILEKPINWGNDKVQLVMMLALDKMTDNEFQCIFNELFDVVNDYETVLKLTSAKDITEFINIMKNKEK
ncbi:BglG family transcription antiterminator [Thermoanaerobacterium thermosaccharolyticum]|uniref:Transcriptional antiterminator n=1 Tax=Thermoanaerobacterium thermosaccharolyticum M0795 TaxID=698948 RepID=L0IN12_THETR|nr:BglG family transcription antiterminator [Thermoanaerobacterium thermosaccharolyticum]AGB19337.1 transcriptional antiterminator [Thermoanaerobacterium thermosaccharolyticum M0795]